MNKPVLLSVKPQFAEGILCGEKTVELRRVFNESVAVGTPIVLYSTSPVKEIVGIAYVEDIKRNSIDDIWKVFGCESKVDYNFFREYFEGKDEGYAVVLSSPKKFEVPISLNKLRDMFGFRPPQSYMYLNDKIWSSISAKEYWTAVA